MAIAINIGVEDTLSEVIIRRMLREVQRGYVVKTRFPTSPRNYERVAPLGYGYLKKNIAAFNAAAEKIPFLVLTDLDSNPCAALLASQWLKEPMHPNFIFRIAIREVEAWLLADRDSMASFLGVPKSKIPNKTEKIIDPKAKIITLARSSPIRDISESIPPSRRSTAQVGPYYQSMMVSFANSNWDIDAAAANCESLSRALEHLRRFNPA